MKKLCKGKHKIRHNRPLTLIICLFSLGFAVFHADASVVVSCHPPTAVDSDFLSYYRSASQACVGRGKNECALAGLRPRTLGPVSAHSRGRECALANRWVCTINFSTLTNSMEK